MKIRKLMVVFLVLAMLLSLSAIPVCADAGTENVIFICDGAEGDGSSAESPLKPTTGNYVEEGSRPERDQDAALYQAWQKLMALGGGTIVICGPYTLDDSNCQPIGAASADFMMPVEEHNSDITITYTSVWNGVDYRETAGAELIMAGKSHLTFPTTTILENLTVRATADNVDHYLCGGMHPFYLNQGTNFIPYEEDNVDAYPMILGGFRNNNTGVKEGNSNIVVDIGNENYVGNIFGIDNGGNGKHSGDSHITIKSGNVGGIYGDSRATGQVPLYGTIYMNFEGGIYRGLIAGVNIGFSGPADKIVNISITGGNFENCLGILNYTTAAEAIMPEAVNVDCSAAPMETALQVQKVVSPLANLIMPDTSSTTEPSNDAAEPTEPVQNGTEEPAQDNSTWVYICVAAVVVVAAVVIVVIRKKK